MIVTCARKPFAPNETVTSNVCKLGVGAINIDASRVEGVMWGSRPKYLLTSKGVPGGAFGNPEAPKQVRVEGDRQAPAGRHPANMILCQSVTAWLDAEGERVGVHSAGTTREAGLGTRGQDSQSMFGAGTDSKFGNSRFGDTGGCSRFFYVLPEPK